MIIARRSRRVIWFVVLVIGIVIYQAPNIALLAHKAGLSIASTDRLGVRLIVGNDWYPVASTDSLLGRLLLSQGGNHVVLYHRYSSIQPWKQEMFAVMAYSTLVDSSLVEATKETPWGRVLLIKALDSADPSTRLYAAPDFGIGFLVGNFGVLSDIQSVIKVRPTSG